MSSRSHSGDLGLQKCCAVCDFVFQIELTLAFWRFGLRKVWNIQHFCLEIELPLRFWRPWIVPMKAREPPQARSSLGSSKNHLRVPAIWWRRGGPEVAPRWPRHWALVKCSISTKSLGCLVRFAHFGGPILGAPTMTSSWSSHESKHECSSEVAAVRLHLLGFNAWRGQAPGRI